MKDLSAMDWATAASAVIVIATEPNTPPHQRRELVELAGRCVSNAAEAQGKEPTDANTALVVAQMLDFATNRQREHRSEQATDGFEVLNPNDVQEL